MTKMTITPTNKKINGQHNFKKTPKGQKMSKWQKWQKDKHDEKTKSNLSLH